MPPVDVKVACLWDRFVVPYALKMREEGIETQTNSPGLTGYDHRYSIGGFGYEANRDKWRRWVQRHYVEAFGLLPHSSAWPLSWPRRVMRRPPRVLDVPCSNGFWSGLLADAGCDVVGVDLSPVGVEIARKSFPNLHFAVGNAEEALPFEEGSFDVVFSRGISHLHRPDLFTEPSMVMARNLMKYVKPNGLMLVSYFTKRRGGGTPSHAYHPVSDLVRLFELAGDVRKVEVVGDFVQLGVRHWPVDGGTTNRLTAKVRSIRER